jgi:hypothetical protein
VQLSKQHVVETLRLAGFQGAADQAMAKLSDPVDLDAIQEWGLKRGVTKDVLMSAAGGSP